MKTITKESSKLINELIEEGWNEFCLDYSQVSEDNKNEEGWFQWEACFSRKLPNGLYDNHAEGVSQDDPNEAIRQAVQNVREGKKYSIREKA